MSQPTSARRSCAAAILAGGRASRLHGADKSALLVGGRPILARQLEAIDGLVDEVFVVGGAPAPGLPDVERIADRAPDHGPLGGIQAALHRAGAAVCTLIVACDLPFLSRPFLAHLLARALDRERDVDVVVPRRHDRLHPLCAAYNRRVREAVDRRVDAGLLTVQALFDELRVDVVGPEAMGAFDPDGVLLWNVNTPEEYERACARAAMS
jgi:molybdopterin-guanine dinucleotide biosynthesis protein A